MGSEKYTYKLEWLDRLHAWFDRALKPNEPAVLCGDFNIAPDDRDVYDPESWRERILCSTPERARFAALIQLGLIDAFRHFHDEPGRFTWWDFRGAMFQRGTGLRVDHHLVTAPLLARAEDVEIDVEERAGHKPSDHAPVTLVLRDA